MVYMTASLLDITLTKSQCGWPVRRSNVADADKPATARAWVLRKVRKVPVAVASWLQMQQSRRVEHAMLVLHLACVPVHALPMVPL